MLSSLHPALALALPFLAHYAFAQEATPGPGKFFFMWPTQVSQCQLVNLTWGAGAVAPFQAWVVPIGQQPFIYHIPASAYQNGQGAYQLQVQLNQGTNYVMLMSDARGIGSGGTSALQIVSSSPNTACLNTASRNQTAKAFSYSVAGRAQQCSPGFELQWDGSPDNAPYNFTVIPLTQSYYPFDVTIDERSGYSSDWVVNMTSGTRFTVLMNDENQYGSGGAAGIYEVANTNNTGSSCIVQTAMGTGAWPVGVATNTLPAATNPIQSPVSRGGITGGAIAGIVIGVLAALALIALILFFLLRRKRRAEEARNEERKGSGVDLADGDEGDEGLGGYSDSQVGAQPLVSPYPASSGSVVGGGRYSAVPLDEARRSCSDGRGEGEMSERGTMTSAGFAGLGAGRERDSGIAGREEGEERVGVAGPLPPKHPLGPLGPSSPISAGRSAGRQPSPALPQSATSTTFPHSAKRDRNPPPHQSQSTQSQSFPLPPGAASTGGMRIVNHDHPDDLPAVASSGAEGAGGRRRESRESREQRQMQFRRHEDAGRVEVVDLPPLYTDVPRETREEFGDVDVGERNVGERSPLSPHDEALAPRGFGGR